MLEADSHRLVNVHHATLNICRVVHVERPVEVCWAEARACAEAHDNVEANRLADQVAHIVDELEDTGKKGGQMIRDMCFEGVCVMLTSEMHSK